MIKKIFEIENVSFCYFNNIPAIDDISFSVEEAKCVVLLGANGSGKSTLLKILDGLYFPKRGTVKAFGKVINEKSLKDKSFNRFFRKSVGFVFQDPDAQLFLPTVRDEIAFAPIQLGFKKDELDELIEHIAEQLNIKKLLDKSPFRLSEGEKKRIAIASIYTLDPEVWLLDEPIFSLDPKTQWWIVELLKSLKMKNRTIVVATHNIGLARIIADYCCVLGEDHRLHGFGKADDILGDKTLLESVNLIHPSGIIA